jgi:hypothetical protein
MLHILHHPIRKAIEASIFAFGFLVGRKTAKKPSEQELELMKKDIQDLKARTGSPPGK